jgi:hypothetical protein
MKAMGSLHAQAPRRRALDGQVVVKSQDYLPSPIRVIAAPTAVLWLAEVERYDVCEERQMGIFEKLLVGLTLAAAVGLIVAGVLMGMAIYG